MVSQPLQLRDPLARNSLPSQHYYVQILWTEACNWNVTILFMPIKQQIPENTHIADWLIALLHSCVSVKQGNLPVSSYASSCDKERQNKLVRCVEVRTLHPSLLPDINPAQNILAVIIPYVEWHNVWSIISTSAFWRIAAPSSSGKQIERWFNRA